MCFLFTHGEVVKNACFSSKPNIEIQDSIKFLENEFNRGISDNYTLALVTYALSAVGSPKAEEALTMLTQQAEKEGNAWDPAEANRGLGFKEYIEKGLYANCDIYNTCLV